MGLFNKTPEQKAAQVEAREASAAKTAEISPFLGRLDKMDIGVQTLLGGIGQKMGSDEKVLSAMVGQLGEAKALLVATDSRILIQWKKGMMSEFGGTELRYQDVDEIQTGRNFGGSFVTLVHGSRVTKIEKSMTSDKSLAELKSKVREQQVSAPVPAAQNTVQAVDPMDQLAKAAQLHKAGVLTDEEFAALKAKVLA